MIFSIKNVVATATLNQPIQLKKVAELPGTIYNPTLYHCVYFHDSRMEGKVSIFSSGKLISIGTRNMKAARKDLQYVADFLANSGLVQETRLQVTIQNIVAVTDLGHPIEFEALSDKLPQLIVQPEVFPGGIYKPQGSPATVLIFASGKLVILGCNSTKQIKRTINNLMDIFE